MAALALGIAAAGVMAVRETCARRLADQNVRQAVTEQTKALSEAYQARLAATTAAMGNHDIREAVRQLALAPSPLRGWEWRHLQARLDQSLAVVAGPSGFGEVTFCPPGERIAVADGRGYAILDAVSGRRLVVRTTDAPCHRVFSSSTRSGLRFAVDHSAETFALDLTDGDGIPISRIATPTADPPWQTRQHLVVAFSGDGRGSRSRPARRGYAPRIELFDTSTGQTTATCDSPGAVLLSLAFSPDGSRLATALESSQLFCFDSATGNRVATLSGHVGSLRAVAYSPDGRHLASCGDDQTIRVWDAETGTMRRTIRGHAGRVNSVAFSPDSRRLVTGGDDGTVRLWTADDGEGRLVLHGHTAAVNRVAFSDDGRTIASASSDGTANLGCDGARGRLHPSPPRTRLPRCF